MWSGYYTNIILPYNKFKQSPQSFFSEAVLLSPEYEIDDSTSQPYINIPFSFDIETSSFTINSSKAACMYIWQVGINGRVIYGRTWDEFIDFLHLFHHHCITANELAIFYIHNFKFEFQWISHYIQPYITTIFATKKRNPLYIQTSLGIEFRDSLLLAGGRSLDYVGKHLTEYPIEKLVGSLDYSKLRHSQTPLTPQELSYCVNDVRVLNSFIQEKIEQEGNISSIPLTNTGYVRRYVRSSCFSSRKREFEYSAMMRSLPILSLHEYQQLRRAFMGGFTHSSAIYSFFSSYGPGFSCDIKSSYPAVICLERFPMSTFKEAEVHSENDLLQYLVQDYACLFDIEFLNITAVYEHEVYLSSSKCTLSKDAIINNGRVVSANSLVTTLTELDFDTVNTYYSWDAMRITNFRYAEKDYLPREIIYATLQLFASKTKLDGLPDKQSEYMLSKNMLNAIYGMMVTAIIHNDYTFKDLEWVVTQADVQSQLFSYNNNHQRFLSYAWGVWVTAYARHNLFSAITELADDYIYSDTDSVKGLNWSSHSSFFDQYNQNIITKIYDSSAANSLDISLYMPKAPDGSRKIIGVFERERDFLRFKTLGAKRYLYQDMQGKFHLTHAGVNTSLALSYLLQQTTTPDDTFNMYSRGLTIPGTHTGKLTTTYIDTPTFGYIKDYLGKLSYFHEYSSVHFEPQEYSLSTTQDYIDFLKGVQYVDD